MRGRALTAGAIVGGSFVAVACGGCGGSAPGPRRASQPGASGTAPVVRQLTYRPVAGVRLGITLRLPRRPRALVVLVHGGGFRAGARGDMSGWAGMLSADGYATATIDYRLAGAGQQGLESALTRAAHDTAAAIVVLRADRALGRVPLVLWGYSAGALTVLRVGAGHPRLVRAVVSLAGYGQPARIRMGAPPMLLFNGTADRVEPIALADATCHAARAVAVRCDQVVYPGATHTITPARAQDIHRHARQWLDSVL